MNAPTTLPTSPPTPLRRYLFAAFAAAHLLCLLYNNVIIEEQTFNDFFLDKEEDGVALTAIRQTGFLYPLFTAYSKLTGAETGYGFYAPNVSSQMVVVFTVKDSLGNTVNVTLPKFSSNETQLRYFTAFDTFLEKLEPGDETFDKFTDIILKSMAYRMLRYHPPHRAIDASIYVYDLPYMPEFRQGERAEYTPVLHYAYALNTN